MPQAQKEKCNWISSPQNEQSNELYTVIIELCEAKGIIRPYGSMCYQTDIQLATSYFSDHVPAPFIFSPI